MRVYSSVEPQTTVYTTELQSRSHCKTVHVHHKAAVEISLQGNVHCTPQSRSQDLTARQCTLCTTELQSRSHCKTVYTTGPHR